jgi:hypothetical protein
MKKVDELLEKMKELNVQHGIEKAILLRKINEEYKQDVEEQILKVTDNYNAGFIEYRESIELRIKILTNLQSQLFYE